MNEQSTQQNKSPAGWLGAAVVGLGLLATPATVVYWSGQADARLQASKLEPDQVEQKVAQNANEAYCTPALKKILRRVLTSCGLVKGNGGRGCEPLEARSVATMAGDDFNALFSPMKDRGGIVQFEKDSADLNRPGATLVDDVFADRKGASYFLVVARASPEGNAKHNSELSRDRAEAVLTHLRRQFDDKELEKQVGLLWLGEEFAQLEESFCSWDRSVGEGQANCSTDELNRSAFMAWIDCRL